MIDETVCGQIRLNGMPPLVVFDDPVVASTGRVLGELFRDFRQVVAIVFDRAGELHVLQRIQIKPFL